MREWIHLDTFKNMYDMTMVNCKTHSYDITDQVITYVKNLNMLVDEPNMIYLRDGKFILSAKAALSTVYTLNFMNEGQKYKFISLLIDYLKIEGIGDEID